MPLDAAPAAEAEPATPPADALPTAVDIFNSENGVLSAVLGLPHKKVESGEIVFEPPARQIKAKPIPPAKAEAKVESKAEGAADGAGEEEFEFGGVKYKSRAAAEHAFSTLRGMHRSQEQRHASLEKANRELAAKIEKLASSVKPGEAKAKAPDSAHQDGEIDSATASKFIAKLISEGRHDDAVAFQADWLERQIESKTKALEDRFEERLKPHEEARHSQETAEQLQAKAADAFSAVGGMVDSSGSVINPLLAIDPDSPEDSPAMLHPAHAKGVMKVWEGLMEGREYAGIDYPALPPEIASSPTGVHIAQAVYLYESLMPHAKNTFNLIPALVEAIDGGYLPELLGLREAKTRKPTVQSKATAQDAPPKTRRTPAVFESAPADRPSDDEDAPALPDEARLMKAILSKPRGII